MQLDLSFVLALLTLGAAAGFLAGLLGIGGGMLLVPALTWLLQGQSLAPGPAVKMAIATSMATIVFTSVSSVRAHHSRGAVRWDVVKSLAPGLLFGGLLSGAGLFSLAKGGALALVFSVFVCFSGWQMLRNRRPAPRRTLPGPVGQFGAGGGIGLLSGLVGAGGGFVSVPFMVWCNVPMHLAVATSAALGFPIALANTLGYIVGGWGQASPLPGSFGYVYVPALVLIAATSVFLAPLGARAAHAMNVAQLKKAFALLLFGLAAYMLAQGLRALS